MAVAASFLFNFCVSPKTFWHSDDLYCHNDQYDQYFHSNHEAHQFGGRQLKWKYQHINIKASRYIDIYWYHYLPSAQADPLGFEEAKPEQERAAKRKASPFRERNSCWYSAAILSPKIKDKALTIWLADVTHLASYHIRVFWCVGFLFVFWRIGFWTLVCLTRSTCILLSNAVKNFVHIAALKADLSKQLQLLRGWYWKYDAFILRLDSCHRKHPVAQRKCGCLWSFF